MKSDDIQESIAQRIFEQTGEFYYTFLGVKIVIGELSKLERAKAFRMALYDYSAGKLPITPENEVTVDDLRDIFRRFDAVLISESEKEEFYTNYLTCILGAYGDLTDRRLEWHRVNDDEVGSFPQIEKNFVTKKSTPAEESVLWLFGEYEKQLKQLQAQEDPPKQRKKSRWEIFRK